MKQKIPEKHKNSSKAIKEQKKVPNEKNTKTAENSKKVDTKSYDEIPRQLLKVPVAEQSLILDITYNNVTIAAHVDSGGHCNFVSRDLVEELGLQPEKTKPMIVQYAKSGITSMTDTGVQLPVEIKLNNVVTVTTNILCYIVKELHCPLYLGLPFLQKYGEHISWRDIKLRARDETSETRMSENEIQPEGLDRHETQETQLSEMSIQATANIDADKSRWVNSKTVGATEYTLVEAEQFEKLAKKQSNYVALMQIEVLEGATAKVQDRLSSGTEQKYEKEIHAILERYAEVVTDEEPKGEPVERGITHRIRLIEGTQPIHRSQYKLSFEDKQELQRQVAELVEKGFIRESESPFNAPVLFVRKKTGEMRLCIDYRALNTQTVKDRFPIPLIDDILAAFGKCKYFSKLDLRSGYHQVRVDDGDKWKTAFSTARNHYEWNVMPFGLTNAPATFQRMMNKVLKDYIGEFVQVYLDDIIIYSTTKEQHIHHLDKVLGKLKDEQLICKKKKCEFFKEEIKFLGFTISAEGIAMDNDKVSVVENWPKIETPKQAQRFLGLTNFYRRFVKGYSQIAIPLINFAAKKEAWSEKQDEAFEQLKTAMTTAPLLVSPKFEEGYKFQITTDACGTALGYVLEQLDPAGKVIGVIAYGSRKLQGAELRYPIRELEFMAIIVAIKTWKYYLGSRKFIIKTDHHSLIYLNRQEQLNSNRMARWIDFLAQFDFDIVYIKGKNNTLADALSRRDDPPDTVNLEAMEYTQEINDELKDQILKGYEHDAEFATIYDVLKNDKPVPKEIRHYITHYKLDNGFLLYNAVEGGDYQLVIPNYLDLHDRLTLNVHELPTGAHFGAFKVYEVLRRQFYWPKMYKKVTKLVRSCDICQRSKQATTLTKGLLKPLPIPGKKMSWITMDFLTGIPTTKKGFDMIFIIVDRLSKRCKLIPCTKNLTGEGAAELFISHYFCNFGIPQKIVSDKDVRFMGGFWQTITRNLGISLLNTTTSHPQTDGQSERQVKTVSELLRMVCYGNIYDWERFLPAVEFACNSTVQQSTQKVPFEVDYGMIPDSPTFTKMWDLDKHYDPRAEEEAQAMEAVMRQTQDFLAEAQRKQEKQHNKRRTAAEFKVGEYVLVHKLVWGGRDTYSKLKPLYFGPFQIVKVINENAVELTLQGGTRKQKTINIQWLKPYVENDKKWRKQPPHFPEYATRRISEVAAIVGLNDEEQTYSVIWDGCDPKHATQITYSQFEMIEESRKQELKMDIDLLRPVPERLRNASRTEDPTTFLEPEELE